MYSSLPNHLFQFSHLIVAFIFLFMFYPKLILKSSYETSLENVISNYILMVFGIIILGYLLVVLKIYEYLGIFIVLLVVLVYVYRNNFKHRKGEAKLNYLELLFDYVDEIKNIKADLKEFVNIRFFKIKTTISNDFKDGTKVWNIGLLLITLGYASYLRLYDAYINAAMPMADSTTTLKWMKFISNRELFPDGIYPQGFHIYLATLQKFAFIDSVYILRYVGPINCVLIVLGIYFVVSRITKDRSSGIIGAIIYGVLISYLYGGFERQAASNSQEFGYLFVIPTLYFFGKYLTTNNKRDFITAFCGLAVTALVHTISFVFIALGLIGLLFTTLIINAKKYFNGIRWIVLFGFISVLVGIIPVGIGLLQRKGFHSSSGEFLTESVKITTFRALTNIDYIALICLALVFIYIVFNFKKLNEKFMIVFFWVVSVVAFLIYYGGGYITQSVVVETRFSDFWNLIAPVIIGMGFYAIICIIRNLKARNLISLAVGGSFFFYSLVYLNPKPIIPYKMEYNANIEQYLKISKELTPTDWTIVSQQEGYAVVLGKGFHVYMKDILKNYNPEKEKLINSSNNEIIETSDVFLFMEKKVFTTQFKDLIDYPLREIENRQLQVWVNKYKKAHPGVWVDKYNKTHSNISLYHEDDTMKIYRIHQPLTQNEVLDRIWGT